MKTTQLDLPVNLTFAFCAVSVGQGAMHEREREDLTA